MSTILQALRKASQRDGELFLREWHEDEIQLFPAPTGSMRKEFTQLAESLLALNRDGQGSTVVFASTVAGEGGSYVSYNVARHLIALLDRRIAWIDGNFRSPQSVLEDGRIDFRQMLLDPGRFGELRLDRRLVLVPNGQRSVKTAELLGGENLKELLESFEREFFFTIIDAPPIMESSEAARLALGAMGLVLVVESRRLKHEVIRHGIARLKERGVNILGTVLNKRHFDIPDFIYKNL